MPEEQQPESNLPAPQKISGVRRRGHRGGRGRRRPAPPVSISGQPEIAESTAKQIEPPIRLQEEAPVRPVPSKPKFQTPSIKPDGSAVVRAVEEVNQIVESLKQSLEQMEEVLELVELAERQKISDEREIENLRRALRKIHQPRNEPRERFEREEREPD